jgi:hypothetical protein
MRKVTAILPRKVDFTLASSFLITIDIVIFLALCLYGISHGNARNEKEQIILHSNVIPRVMPERQHCDQHFFTLSNARYT